MPVNALTLAGAWVAVSSAATLAGWGLSLGGWLNGTGYLVVMLAGLAAAAAWLRTNGARLAWRGRARRYRAGWPAVFAGALLLAVLGALWHAPNNIDAVTYRLPRVLHWLAAGRWHWIDTVDPRLNYSGCGQEWLLAPQLALLRTDRLAWLPNAIGFALLPGLLFALFRGLGVAGPVARRWMWLLPLAPVYLLQAGSLANDLTGAVYFVAALAFAARARREGAGSWLALSVLALALATGIKASNLPLVLPWLVFIRPAPRMSAGLRRSLAVVAVPAALVSIAPTLAANRMFSGDWMGDPANVSAVRADGPWSGCVGNAVEVALQNLSPPVFPGAGTVERRLTETLAPAVRRMLGGDFPRFSVHVTELAQEEWSGLGLPVLILLFAGAVGGGPARAIRRDVIVAGGMAGLAFFLLMGSEMPARLLAAYYPLAVGALLLCSGQTAWTRSRAFRRFAVVTSACSLLPLIVSPARPLLPVDKLPGIPEDLRERAAATGEVYARRPDPLAILRGRLPAEVRRVGFLATADDSELSFWRPFGGRRVETVRVGETAAGLQARGIEWIAVRADAAWPTPAARAEWLTARSATVVETASIRAKVRRPPEEWALVRVGPPR